MNGAPGLWRLWRAVSAALAGGRSYGQLLESAAAPAVRSAITMLVEQLRAHDMLVEVPQGWGESDDPADPPLRIAAWLAAVAADPVDAWQRIRSAAVGVGGTGPVAAAAVRALAGAGVKVLRPQEAPDRAAVPLADSGPYAELAPATGPVVLATVGLSVAAAAGGEVGYVTPVGHVTPVAAPTATRRDAELIGERIGLPTGVPAAVVLAALVGGAAAHRLVCAIAGLPDPGEDVLAATRAPASALGRPTALVARLDPLTAEYHPWWQTAEDEPPTGGAPGPADPPGPDTVMARVEALSDPETGALPVLAVDDLPQSPAGLAACDAGGTVVCGTGVDTAMARLTCAIGAAERLIAQAPGGGPVVVGADARHAEGVRLRRLLHTAVAVPGAAETADVAEAAEEWGLSPGARRWYKAVTLRFGVRADLRVAQLAHGVFHAELRDGTDLLAWAMESTAADAAAFCALAAAGTLQWRAAGGDPAAPVYAPCGALPVPAADAADTSPLRADAWIRPAGASEREDALQRELRALLGARAGSATPLTPTPGLLRALSVAGFAVLEASP
jgi:hypothetical protein